MEFFTHLVPCQRIGNQALKHVVSTIQVVIGGGYQAVAWDITPALFAVVSWIGGASTCNEALSRNLYGMDKVPKLRILQYSAHELSNSRAEILCARGQVHGAV